MGSFQLHVAELESVGRAGRLLNRLSFMSSYFSCLCGSALFPYFDGRWSAVTLSMECTASAWGLERGVSGQSKWSTINTSAPVMI